MKNKLIFTENYVVKQFHSKIAFDKEKQILSLLAGSGMCPDIVNENDNCLKTSFLEGITLSEAIEEKLNLFPIFEKLVQWLAKFNSLTKEICLDDINLKNFIYLQKENITLRNEIKAIAKTNSLCYNIFNNSLNKRE